MAHSTVELPVLRVTCLEDRAQVERQGEVALSAGVQKVRIEGVSPLVVDRSLKVELPGAALVDARVVRTFLQRPRDGVPEDASEVRKRVRALEKEIEARGFDVQRLEARHRLVLQSRTDLSRAICEEAGAGKADPERWSAQLKRLWDEDARLVEELRVARREHQHATQKLGEARVALQRSEEEVQELACSVELSIDAPAATRTRLKVGYLVPCALWRPAYRATLASGQEGERVSFEADAVVWQRTGETWRDVELVFSTARPTLGANPPSLTEDQLALRDKSAEEKTSIDVSIREEEIQTVGEGGRTAAVEMPGLDDGGEVRVLSAPQKATVPSDGQPHRVHLFAFEAPVTSERLCTPEKSPLSSLVARFENGGRHPLLAGPVDLVREGGFVGRGEVKFAAPGEKVKLSFGSEDAVRVVRDVREKTETSKLTGRRTTTRSVSLYVSNAGGEPVKLAVEERIPVSEIAQVEVKLLNGSSRDEPKNLSKDGILRYELSLEGRAHKQLFFEYELSASSKVVGL
ncbi:MAG TPA: mucoidy inhibitor MuiA family protein [Myxococcaceae bacterium]|nr:mucoidy inhibitor MuiA family protein [Myxococcaceae bacterium]